jgi:tellurite resistance protein
MSDEFFAEIEIREDHAEAIARGLFAVARADGEVHPREAAMISEFFTTTNDHASQLASLERQPPLAAEHLAAALPSAPLRQLFVKTAILLAHVDNDYSPNESRLIAEYATACGIDATQLAQLQASVKDYLLSHLSHLQNVAGVAQVASELKR